MTTTMTIHERTAGEQLVLTEQRHVTAEGLRPWLQEAMPRAHQTGPYYGGLVGPVMVLYHGEIDHEQDGPVEVCGPIAPPAGITVAHATRTEPAHHEAYIQLSREQVAYPEITHAYAALERWSAANGRELTGVPREIYFGDFFAAAPDEPVVDLAFPITPAS